jgi:hypothetical protein
MPQGLYVDKPQSIFMKAYQEPDLQDDEVRIRTEFADIKHGTDFHLFSGQSPFQDNRFDLGLRLFVKRMGPEAGGLAQQFAGNMAVGIITEIGSAVTSARVGEHVFCYAPTSETLTKLVTEAEWFHNRLELICSMPVWDNPLREYPLWDERRLWHTVTTFFQKQRLTSHGIVDPIVTFPEAAMAFLNIYHDPTYAVKLGIRFLADCSRLMVIWYLFE